MRAVHEVDANVPRPVAQFPTYRENAVGTAKTPRARRSSFSPSLCALCAFAVQTSGTAKAGRPRSGREFTNARIRPARWRKFPTYRENRGWNRQDAKSAKVFFFSFPLRPLRLRGSNPRNRQSGPSPNRARIHECTNTPGPRPERSDLSRHYPAPPTPTISASSPYTSLNRSWVSSVGSPSNTNSPSLRPMTRVA